MNVNAIKYNKPMSQVVENVEQVLLSLEREELTKAGADFVLSYLFKKYPECKSFIFQAMSEVLCNKIY